MENMINTECGSNSCTAAEQRRIKEFREAAGHIFSETMIDEMADLGFFLCPASLSHHGDYLGGLFDHSMQVFHNLEDLTNRLDLTWQRRESPLLIAVFHDWVKMQNYNQTGTGKEIHYIRDSHQLFPGHGEVSVIMAQQFLSRHKRIKQLTYEELACIRYHMGAFTDKEEWDYYTDAVKRYPNVLWTHTADMLASQIKGI